MNKLSTKEKFAYGLGEIGSSIVWQGMMFYLGFFYTDVFQIPAAAAGFLLFVPKFLDALVDPIIGTIADRTNTKHGKFRPYILWLFIPYSIFMVLTFATPDLAATGKLIYAYATYMIMMLLYSFIMTPYNALGGVITSDHVERTSLQSYRFFMAFFGGFIVRVLTNPLVAHFGDGLNENKMPLNPQQGFTYTFIVFAVISAICFYLTFRYTKERVRPMATQKSSLKQDLGDLMKNRPWIILFIVSTLNLLYVGVFGTATKYYFDYYVTVKEVNLFGWNVGGLDVMSVFNGFSSIVIMLMLISPVSTWMANKMG
ncbi:MAG: MFS transporter, partial [Cytophagales bacterium]|nr:MFS transporter [Cytophagales bacterium]